MSKSQRNTQFQVIKIGQRKRVSIKLYPGRIPSRGKGGVEVGRVKGGLEGVLWMGRRKGGFPGVRKGVKLLLERAPCVSKWRGGSAVRENFLSAPSTSFFENSTLPDVFLREIRE